MTTRFTAHDGSTEKISDIATLSQRKTLARIVRENRQYVRIITFEYMGPYRYGLELLQETIASVPLRPGYSMKIENMNYMFGDAETIEIVQSLLLSALLIFILSAALFESLRLPILVVGMIPIALVGAVYAMWWFDVTLNRGAYAGMLLLIGLSANIAIVMLYQMRRTVAGATRHTRHEAMTRSIALCFTRIRPVAMTALTTMVAMIPLILQERQEFWRSLGSTVVGGIIWSSVFALVVVPVLLSAIYPIQNDASSSRS
jgi:multidrug efflux pump subunit AcrB